MWSPARAPRVSGRSARSFTGSVGRRVLPPGFYLAASGGQAEQYRKAGRDLAASRAWDHAIENYRKALALEPGDADTHYNLALDLEVQRRREGSCCRV